MVEKEFEELSGVELIDTTTLDKIIVDKNYYKDNYKKITKQNKRLASEVSRLARIVNERNRKSK